MWTSNEDIKYVLWLVKIDKVAAQLAAIGGGPAKIWDRFLWYRERLLNDYATRLGFPPGSPEVQGAPSGDRGRAGRTEAGGSSTGCTDAQYPGQDAGRAAGPDPAEHATPAQSGSADSIGQTSTAPNASKSHGQPREATFDEEWLHRAANNANTPEYP